MKEKISYCGLNCEECDAYIATLKDDDSLRREVASKWGKIYNNDSITPESINCEGCRQEDGMKLYFCSHICEIRKCVLSKSLETCGKCLELDKCKKIKYVFDNNAEAKERILNNRKY